MKATPAILLDEIADDFTQFLMNGNLSSFTKKINPNFNIENLKKLLGIHFILTKQNKDNPVGVIDFIEKLQERLRRIKTTTALNTQILKSEVKGKLNYSETIKYKFRDPQIFICENRARNIDAPENIVLKSLLGIINEIIQELNFAEEYKYNWFKEWFDEKQLNRLLKDVFLKNVYLKRIKHNTVILNERLINKVKSSRIPLYREAAFLMLKYIRLMNYEIDYKEAAEILQNTFIKPDKVEVLFELYWAIKIIKKFENPTFMLIEPGSNIIAQWENEGFKYVFYHNSSGSFDFRETINDLDNKLLEKDNFFGRKLLIIKKMEELTMRTGVLWGGRPDLILEKYDAESNKLLSVFIGEVKYTDNKDYALQGLQELLEYMAFLKRKGQYVEKYENLFLNMNFVKGALFVDSFDFNIPNNDAFKIFSFGDDLNLNI
jgi:hypothetical protein